MKRGGDFRETVYCFGEEEGETYTLCRWLRARKFDLAETIKMVEEATVVRSEPALSSYQNRKLKHVKSCFSEFSPTHQYATYPY